MEQQVTALIIDFHRPEETQRAVESIKAQSYRNIEIRVWNNNNTNWGVATPSNSVANQSKSKYLFFLDNDAYLTDHEYIKDMVRFIERFPRCGIVFGRVTNKDGTDQWLNQFRLPNPDETDVCGSFNGSGCLVRKSAWVDAGGYDPLLFAYYLEPDLAARLYRNGWFIQYMPIRSVHEQTQKSRISSAVLYYMVRNHYIYLIRHIPWYYATPHILKWPVWGLTHAKGDYRTVVRAHHDAAKMLPRLLTERRPTKEEVIIRMWGGLLR